MVNKTAEAPIHPDQGPDAPPRIVESDELLRGAEQIAIRHNGRLYRLRRTRLGKLILTA